MLGMVATGMKLETETGQTEPEETGGNKARRLHRRRDVDQCVSVVDGKDYPVHNWSQGGALIFGDSRPFAMNNEVDVTLKFRIRDEIVDVPHKARVVRKSFDKVGLKFLPLTRQVKRVFQSVIDDYMTAEFAESQLVHERPAAVGKGDLWGDY